MARGKIGSTGRNLPCHEATSFHDASGALAMPVQSFIHSLGSLGVFPSRAFLPAFVAAFLLRFGDSLPLVAHTEFTANVHAPSWFISNTSLVVLGILSCLECWATKNADVRELLHQFDGAVKPAMTLLTTLGIASVEDAEVVRGIQGAGVSDGVFGVMAAGAVYVFTTARQSLYELLSDIDSDDSLGIQKLFSWAEDAWVVFGAVMLVVFPLLMILLTAVVFGLLYLWQKAAHAREKRLRVPCGSCGNPLYHCAIACPACGAANRQVCAVNWLGLPKLHLAADPADHSLRLIAVRRCPLCATRLKQKRPRQSCESCRREVFSDDAQVTAYLQLVQSRLGRTLLICFLMGLVPVVGVVPAIVFYRLHLISPLRRYVPFGSALLAKWLGRFACFGVLSMQWIPIFGIGSLPIMATINYVVYRRAFQSAWRSQRQQAARSHGQVVLAGSGAEKGTDDRSTMS